MANNPNVNKVVYGDQTVMDITDTTAEAADVASGEVFYDRSGARTVGTGSFDSAVWGNITGDIDDQTDLQGELAKKVITLTKAQYDALSTAEKNDPKKVYYITDYEATGTYSEIDDTATAIDKLWSSSKISSELNSTTRIDDTTTAQNKTWSSTKISTEIDGKLSYSVNDATDTDIADADFIPYYDYSASTRKKSTWANIVAKIKAFFGSAAYKDVPTSGNASTAQVVMGNDTRLTDSRPASDVYSWAKASTKPAYTYSEITGTPTLATVATSGDYDDLTGKPDLNDYAPLASPAFTGTPTAPTAASGTRTTQLANTAFVQMAINGHMYPYLLIRRSVTASAGSDVRIPESGTDSKIYPGLLEVYIPVAYSDTPIKFSQIKVHSGYLNITMAQGVTNIDMGVMIIM